jgi:pimeloyl-ACP methyl ester carboxylesterase
MAKLKKEKISMVGDSVSRGRVNVDGCKIYYEVRGRGNGIPLLMIPAAGGNGDYYHPLANLMSDVCKVITYDRRDNSRSISDYPQSFEVSRQSADAVSVLGAAGEASAVVFGNSSGAVIALDMAKRYPQSVRAVIIHEPAAPSVLPDANKWKKFFAKCYLSSLRWGAVLGAFKFMTGAKINIFNIAKAQKRAKIYAQENRIWEDETRISVKDNLETLMKQELLPVTNYIPDIETLKCSKVKVFIGVSCWAKKRNTWIARVCKTLCEKLDCPIIVFPGGHGGYMEEPQEWRDAFRDIILRRI